MIRFAVAVMCILAILTTDAFAMEIGEWESFTGVGHPTSAEIEVVEQGRDSILVDMTLDGMKVQEREQDGTKFHFLSIPQADWTKETGKPRLPVIRTLLSIPSNGDVEIQIEDENHTILKGYKVYPVGKEVVRRGEFAYIDEEFAFDEEFYSLDGFYPKNLADVSFSGYLRDQRLIQLELHPITYNPRSGELICRSFLRVRLTYDGRAGGIAALSRLGPLASVYQSSVANSPALMDSSDRALDTGQAGSVNYPNDLLTSQNADYIIIAPESFYNSDKLRQLADWRAEYNGFDVAVVSTAKLYYSFGQNSVKTDERIRLFIQYAYNYWRSGNMQDGRVGYILLIGDVDFIPIHTSDRKSFDEQITTDNWYVCISGDDLMPDIMLGRLPAKNTNELNIMIDKIIQYEQDPLYGDWANNALLLLGTVESLREDMEYARDEYLLPAGYNVSEVSGLDGGGASQIVSMMNRGQQIVDYAGHGWVNGWEIFQKLDIPRLKNDRKLPAIFSLACSTGYFDHPDTDSVAEAFLKARNGAIAFFGSSRLASISSVGFGLSEAVAGSHINTLGEITMHTKLKLLPYSTNMELYNLLGDPALDLSAPRRQPGKSDLVISPVDISFEPEEPGQGEPVTISIYINNLGTDDARDVTMELRDSGPAGPMIESHSITRIPAGGRTEIQTVWNTPLGEAQHPISVSVHTAQRSDEYYRENNDAQKTLLVSLESEGWPLEVEERLLSAPVAADLDTDGDMELLIQSLMYDNNRLYVLHHDGQPVIGWPRTVYKSNSSRYQYSNSSAGPAPAVGDLDGDGAPEIVAAFFGREVRAWRSDGSALPGWPVRTSGYATSSPVLADLDADGSLEVIFGLDNGQMYIRRHDGSEFLGWPISVGSQGHLFPAVIDMDNDGDLEIVAAHSPLPKNSSVNISTLYAWHHDGTPLNGWPVRMRGAETVLPPSAGDLDGDGTAEIAMVSVEDDVCRVYLWDHDGSSAPGWPVQIDNEIRAALTLGDLNQDGDVEIIGACRGGLVYAWHHNGGRVFGWPVNLDSDTYYSSAPVLGDVDGDDQVEVIFSSYGGVVHAYKHDGVRVQGWPAITESRSNASPPAIADMDGDGKTELVYASGTGRIHNLSLKGNYSTHIEWNMFAHDQMHTGSYNAKAILPLPPENLIAADLPDDKGGNIILSWQVSPDDSKATGYVIYRSDSFDGRYSIIGKVARGVATYTDDTAQAGVTYWYMVRTSDGAYLSTGSSPVSTYSINNFAPNPPGSVYAEKGGIDNTIEVWWLIGEEPDLAGYKIYGGTESGVYNRKMEAGMANHYVLTGLANGTAYYISVTAYDTEGNESLRSEEVTGTPGDDDTDPPSFSAFHPDEVTEDAAFFIKCKISDPSGVYDDSSGESLYLLWDNDGELSESSRKMRMSLLSPGVYSTDAKLPGQSLADQFVYQVYAYDNDFDWNREEDRTPGSSSKQKVKILRSPSRAYNYPNPAPSGRYTDRTVFRYYADSDAKVEINIYDVSGHLVDTLKAEANGGRYSETEWLISDISSGVYIYTIEIQPASGNKQFITKKLAVVK